MEGRHKDGLALDDSPIELSQEELAHWLVVSQIPGIGPARFRLLRYYFHDDLITAWKSSAQEWKRAGVDQRTIQSFLQWRSKITPLQELQRLTRMRIRALTIRDLEYPALLKQVPLPPQVLYLRGHLTEADGFTLAIVGTRRITTYGVQTTEKLAFALAEHHVTIVSGLALGVDTVAHTAALEAGGRTLAILGCGLDTIYPPRNMALAKKIVESGQGALISEFPPGIQPESGNFPARNRIISGLSLGVLVTEAPFKSGALLTVGNAHEQGREVFAVPGSIFSRSSQGTNQLLKDGLAHPVTEVQDIIEALNLFMIPQQLEFKAILPDNDEERTLLALLSHEPRHIDELIQASGLTATTVSSTLMMLEIKRSVHQVGAMQFVLNARGAL